MTSSRQRILDRLSRDAQPFPDVTAVTSYLPMIPVEESSPAALRSLFVQEAQNAGCVVHQPGSTETAVEQILQIVGIDTAVSCWEIHHIPLAGLEDALKEADVARVNQDAFVRVGLTSADAALASTGSVVVTSGGGQYRASSLMPPVHIAVLNSARILPNLESWWAEQRKDGLDQFRDDSNVVIITGPSRTADIALQPVMGMHGPGQLHIVLVDDPI